MKLYELTYLIKPKLTEQEVNNLFSKIETLLQESKGMLIQNRKHKIIDLGNKIKNQSKALLAVVKFQMETENQKLLNAKIKKIPEIIRFSILRAKPIQIGKAVPKIGKKLSKPKPIKTIEKKKVELKEIGKQLEEILKHES